MAVKKKTTTDKIKKVVKREPSPAALLKKVAGVSESNKTLQKEIKSMSKIFGENQKILVSMKGMIDSLTLTLENIQKQSKQINILEEDTQKLYSGLNQIRTQSSMVDKLNDQATRLQEEINRISEEQKKSVKADLAQQVEDSMNSIRNNSQMIIKIAQRIDEVRDDLRKVSGKTDSVLEINSEIEKMQNSIEGISLKTTSLESSHQTIQNLREELKSISGKIKTSNVNDELNKIKNSIDEVSSEASKINSLGGVIEGIKLQFETVAKRTNDVENTSLQSIRDLAGKIDKIETNIGSLSKRADSTVFIGEELKIAEKNILDFKDKVSEKTNNIEEKISSISETLENQDKATSEFQRKSEKLFDEIHTIKETTSKATSNASKEMMALLKLSEYQSNIRMYAESKYGDVKMIEKMASQTKDIARLFDKISIEAGHKIPLPHEVRQWAISKIFDCADKWEVRFSDVYSILTNSIGRDMVKESVRIQQIRDIYGIRGVDEIRKDLNIS